MNDWSGVAEATPEEAYGELKDALTAAGVKLPSLSIEAVSYAGWCTPALIELGRCNVATARALAAALRSGAVGEGEG
ncbi:hypothetical protein [Streptomyces sp. 891-h]|uniref:hypothetical protein n=1 Tax=unclassified Streptomyces TaxID=2593676 RepID=UPI001FA9D0B5|nr:hypothetical protein [Streptomyces sp. 891-h]UNZ19070.1 hypothetical protein HC362_20490 [Streptomyces sp. 891-h]